MSENLSKFFTCPWEILQSNDVCNKWLIKFVTENGSYQMVMTDTADIFMEVLNEEEIAARCKEMNNRLEAPVNSVVVHLKGSILQHHHHNFKTEFLDDVLLLSLSNNFHSGIPFNWKFHCIKNKSGSLSWTKLLLCDPMILSISRLLLENSKLKEIIKRKDNEIKDYKESGYKVSRPHLETKAFDAIGFDTDVKCTREYATAVTKEPLKIMATKSVNDLMISSINDSKSAEVKELLSQSSPSKSVSTSYLTNAKSPNKQKVKRRKPCPTARGCVLEEEEESPTSEEQIKDKQTEELTVPSKKAKVNKRRNKGKLF